MGGVRVGNGIPIFNLIMRCESDESRRCVKLLAKEPISQSHEKTIITTTQHGTAQRCSADCIHNEIHSQCQYAGMHWSAVSCVVLCGRGDCLFVRSPHGDKIMFEQWTIY